MAKKTTTEVKRPQSREERDRMIAAVQARHQKGDLTAEEAQAEIDHLNGVVRIHDASGNASVVDENIDLNTGNVTG